MKCEAGVGQRSIASPGVHHSMDSSRTDDNFTSAESKGGPGVRDGTRDGGQSKRLLIAVISNHRSTNTAAYTYSFCVNLGRISVHEDLVQDFRGYNRSHFNFLVVEREVSSKK